LLNVFILHYFSHWILVHSYYGPFISKMSHWKFFNPNHCLRILLSWSQKKLFFCSCQLLKVFPPFSHCLSIAPTHAQCPSISTSAIFKMRTSSIIYKNYKEMREGICQPVQWLLLPLKKYWKLGREEQAAIMCLLYFEIYKRGL